MFELGNLESFPLIYIVISVIGIFISRFNLIIMLLALDIIIFSISLMFIYLSLLNYDPLGQIYAFLLLPIAATETALGLSLLIIMFTASNKSTLLVIL
jgi:NADH-quinone oxidoreductase subunit K